MLVNIRGYDPSSIKEKYEFGFVVASIPSEAKNKAKSKWLIDSQKNIKMLLILLKSIMM